ncbi:signal transduction histidine kinase BaeS domain protein [Escherichia coli]|nr:signal transduction histidine kinase BaeS domain protein [Escherichia coli]
MTPVFLQIGLGFSPFHAGLMMIPMVLGSMGMSECGTGSESLWLSSGTGGDHAGLSLVTCCL